MLFSALQTLQKLFRPETSSEQSRGKLGNERQVMPLLMQWQGSALLGALRNRGWPTQARLSRLPEFYFEPNSHD